MISGTTALVAHMGYPTHTFKSSLICNPWFEKNGVDAVVVPMGIKAEDYPDFFRSVFTLTNIRGALITMPHKVTTMELVDEISPSAQTPGATNAVLRREDGSLLADQFDGAGFVRGVLGKGFDPSGKRAWSRCGDDGSFSWPRSASLRVTSAATRCSSSQCSLEAPGMGTIHVGSDICLLSPAHLKFFELRQCHDPRIARNCAVAVMNMTSQKR